MTESLELLRQATSDALADKLRPFVEPLPPPEHWEEFGQQFARFEA